MVLILDKTKVVVHAKEMRDGDFLVNYDEMVQALKDIWSIQMDKGAERINWVRVTFESTRDYTEDVKPWVAFEVETKVEMTDDDRDA